VPLPALAKKQSRVCSGVYFALCGQDGTIIIHGYTFDQKGILQMNRRFFHDG